MRKIMFLLLFIVTGYFVNAQTFFTEDFENGGSFPAGWTLTSGTGQNWQIGDGTYHGPGAAHTGTYSAYFNDYDYTSGTTAEMISPAIDLSSTTLGDVIVLSYWYWDGGDADVVVVSVSTDGTTFTPIDTTNATVDPWAQQLVDLSAYAGQATVYISFKGTSVYGFSNPNVDDILVKEVIPNDLAAIDVQGPTPYCGMSLDTIRMSIVNVGTASQNTYSASYSLDGGTTWTTPENITTTLNTGDNLLYTFTTLADFSNPGTYDLIAAVSLSGDGDSSNDTTIVNQIIIYPTVTSLSYTENFDANPDGTTDIFANNWTADLYTGFGWKAETTTTTSSGTGPSGPSSGTGTYMYLETSSGSLGDIATLTGPCLDLSGITNSIVLSYKYHMYGATMGNLYTDVQIGGIWTCIDTIAGQQQTADTDPWLTNVLPLTNNVERIRFRGERGTSYTGDMAIDDILIKEIFANDLAAIDVQGPTPYCGMSLDTIRMSIVNVGTSAQTTYSASYSLDGGTTWITPENITTTLNTGDTLNYTFTTLADFSTPGTYNLVAAVNLSGDGDNSNDTIIGTTPIMSTPVISSYPYTQDFEGTQYWSAGGTNSTWALGAPAGSVINSAASGSNAWVTNLTGNYNSDENSFVESPCFDFSTLHNPLVQFNYWVDAEGDGSWNYDGAILKYSTDDGTTWNTVGNLNDWSNWYNMSSISGLSSDGWGGDGSNGSNGWVEAKHLLTNLAGQPSVKFRVYFGSDFSGQYDGFAFDDFTIREGNVNLTITEINYNGPESPTDTTEFIEWYNYGQDAVNINGYYYSQGVIDTLPDVTVLPGGFFVSAYDSTVMANFFGYTDAIQWDAGALSNAGEDIALHTSWGTLVDSVFYDDANGWPTQPDGHGPSLVFCEQNIGMDANDPANWNISTSYVDTLNGMDVYASPGALDSTCYTWDLAIADIQTGDTIADCSFTATDTVGIELLNLGNTAIPAGDTIFGWYQLNTDPVVADTMVLNADFNPGDTITFMFNQTADLSALGYYDAGLWFNYFNDVEQMNDSAFITLYHYQPVVDLGPDTIWTAQPDTVVLDAGAGFDSYIWQDSSTAQTFTVATAGTYFVTALDSNDCSASDTVVVELLLFPPDLTITEPMSGNWYDCHLTATDTAEILFTNLASGIIPPGDTIYFWYQIDNNPVVADTLVLTAAMNQNDTLPFVFDQTIDFSALATYNFSIWLNYQGDTIQSNDTVSGTLTHYELSINLGPDTICTTQPDTIVLDPGAGFDAYLWQDSSTAQTFTVTTYGTYFVQVYDTNWCDATDTIVIDNCVGIEETELSGISIYPNPNDGQFVIDMPNAENVRIEVLTISGQVVYLKQTVNAHNVINLTEFDKGIYFVRLISSQGISNYKIVIQ